MFKIYTKEDYLNGLEKSAGNVRALLNSRLTELQTVNRAQVDTDKEQECLIIRDLLKRIDIAKSIAQKRYDDMFDRKDSGIQSQGQQQVYAPPYAKPSLKDILKLVDEISSKEFSLQNEGYDMNEVDNFLDEICEGLDAYALGSSHKLISKDAIVEKEFSLKKRGYSTDEVDQYLDRIIDKYPE